MADLALANKTAEIALTQQVERHRDSSSDTSSDEEKKKKTTKTNQPSKPSGKPVMVPQETKPRNNDSSDDESKKKPVAEKPTPVKHTGNDSDTSSDRGKKNVEAKKKKKQTKPKPRKADDYSSDSSYSSDEGDKKKKKKKEADWVKHHAEMKKSMITPRLKSSVGNKDNPMLKRAIRDAEAASMSAKDEHLVKAKHTTKVLDQRKKLQTAVEKNDATAIKRELDVINGNIRYYVEYCSIIQREVYEAECLLDDLYRAKKKSENYKMVMDRNTMSAIKHFKNPPREVHRVMQGALLLLRCDTKMTSDWTVCQSMCNPVTTKKILDFDIDSVHPDIAAKARQVLSEHKLSQLKPVSQAAATFYVWGMGTVDECDRKNGKGRAADIRRQQDIFSMPPTVAKSRSSSVATSYSRRSSMSSVRSRDSRDSRDHQGNTGKHGEHVKHGKPNDHGKSGNKTKHGDHDKSKGHGKHGDESD